MDRKKTVISASPPPRNSGRGRGKKVSAIAAPFNVLPLVDASVSVASGALEAIPVDVGSEACGSSDHVVKRDFHGKALRALRHKYKTIKGNGFDWCR